MKTDRELLELAAKSAGYAVDWREWVRSHVAEFATVKHVKCAGFWLDGKEWNPLTDDGDALRLAVKLRILVDVTAHSTVAIVNGTISAQEKHNGDPYAATSRAIVGAAAAIEEGMR